MEQNPPESSASQLTPVIQNMALEYANRLFRNAYDGQSFERITIEDIDALVAHTDFRSALYSYRGGEVGDELIKEFKQYNRKRKQTEGAARSMFPGMDRDEIEEQEKVMWPLHHRPEKPEPTPEEEAMF